MVFPHRLLRGATRSPEIAPTHTVALAISGERTDILLFCFLVNLIIPRFFFFPVSPFFFFSTAVSGSSLAYCRFCFPPLFYVCLSWLLLLSAFLYRCQSYSITRASPTVDFFLHCFTGVGLTYFFSFFRSPATNTQFFLLSFFFWNTFLPPWIFCSAMASVREWVGGQHTHAYCCTAVLL